MKEFNKGIYMVAMVGGMAAGLCFSKAMYHKGRYDAFTYMEKKLDDLRLEADKLLTRKTEGAE